MAAAAGSNDEYVRLISAEGHEFVVAKKCAMVSGTIRSMLSGPGTFTEQQMGVVTFPEISTPVLEKVIQYFYYKVRYPAASDMPEFKIDPSIALELLMAANFLDT